ncbi:MAG: hypothetical protein WD226_02185 [Planctomycetota bacterium]
MGRRQKQFDQLDQLEAGFRGALLAGLRECASGGDDLFFMASHLVPVDWGPRLGNAATDELLATGAEIQTTRTRLGLDPEDCLAAYFESACYAAMKFEDYNRLGARRRAAVMLAEIEGPS